VGEKKTFVDNKTDLMLFRGPRPVFKNPNNINIISFIRAFHASLFIQIESIRDRESRKSKEMINLFHAC
jgi:hypothetical protein